MSKSKHKTQLGVAYKKQSQFPDWYTDVIVKSEMISYYDCHLEKEKDHVEGFAAEVAWWTNVVRWEFKYPTPFLRTREFLWQEGHTAYATAKEADVEVFDILDLYARVYEELLAVPFAGGRYTTTVEAFIPSASRAIQGATSHSLGQNFAKMFNISFEGENASIQFVWQNSWGLTTRTIGVMIMVHGDDKGLVLPPLKAAILSLLRAAGVRVKVDDRSDKTSAWKFNYWELKGVPLRVQIGQRDLENGTVELARRDTHTKSSIAAIDARKDRDANIGVAMDMETFKRELNKGKMILTPWCEMKDTEEWVKEQTRASKEEKIKKDGEVIDLAEEAAKGLTGSAKTLCLPFSQPPMPKGTKCFTGNGKDATSWCLWGRSY
eukprot:GSMAST32.ASY1.ANO1.2827.1 assembled CDS